MSKESSSTLRICDWIEKYSIYAAIFLTPLFFLPQTSEILDFNKQALLILLVAISLFAWMIRILISGSIEFNSSKVHIVAAIFFLVYLLSTIFSVWSYGSFWGWPQMTLNSMLSVIGFLLFYFIVSNNFSKKNIFTSVLILLSSAFFVELVGVFQLFGLFIFPVNFAKSVMFNTISSPGGLALFSAILLPIQIIFLMMVKKWWRVLFAVEVIISGIILVLVNYSVVWWVVVAVSSLLIFFGIIKRNLIDVRWMSVPTFFLAVSLFFIIWNPQVNLMAQNANELFLSQKASFNIVGSTLKERPLLGSGPGTFSYDFSKFKGPDFSKTSLWNVVFNSAGSKILDDLATIGILGVLAFLALMIFPIFYSVRYLAVQKPEKETGESLYLILAIGLCVALISESLSFFLYNSSFVLSFIYFMLIACLINLSGKGKKSYELKSSSLLTLVVTFAFTLMFIFGLGILILDGQRYVAEVNYYNGLSLWQTGNKDAGRKSLETAASLNPSSDLYFRQLSQAYLSLLQDELKNTKTTPSNDEKNKIQALVVNSINSSKIATDLNPQSLNDWSNRGYIYQSLFGLVQDSAKWALSSYDRALTLDSNNPYLYFQEGNVNIASAQALSQDNSDQKNQLFLTAKTELEKAVSLNPNYSDALYSLGLVYDALDQEDKAIGAFTVVLQLNPQNADIAKILNILKAGGSISKTATMPAENPSSENIIKNSSTPASFAAQEIKIYVATPTLTKTKITQTPTQPVVLDSQRSVVQTLKNLLNALKGGK